jgi:hypothetical protein
VLRFGCWITDTAKGSISRMWKMMLTKIEVEKVAEEVARLMLKLGIETEIDFEKNRFYIVDEAFKKLQTK